MKEELKRMNYGLKCGKTITLDLYMTLALSLNCTASTYNCTTNHLKISLISYV